MRSSELISYHRDLSRRAAARANVSMRQYFIQGDQETLFGRRVRRMRKRTQAQVATGWSPLIGRWDRGIAMRLRGSDAMLLGSVVYEDRIARMAKNAVIEEIKANPEPFVRTLLEDLVVNPDPYYQTENNLLERLRDRNDGR